MRPLEIKTLSTLKSMAIFAPEGAAQFWKVTYVEVMVPLKGNTGGADEKSVG